MSHPATPRRILMTTDTVGGVWNYALELSRALAAHGVEITLATMGPCPSRAQRATAAALDNVTLCESEFRLEWMGHPWDDVAKAGEWLLELEQQVAPDVIHLNGYAHGALPWTAPVLMVGHSCVLSWWRAVRGGIAPAQWNHYRDVVRTGLHAADLVIAPTRAMLDALEYHYGLLNESEVIPNGRSRADFFSAEDKEPFILSVGRLWDEAKNAQQLTAIAPLLSWPVRVAGEPATPDGDERVLPNVELMGYCDSRELARLYSHASIYALPAYYEPFGLSVLEAALSGCALVLGDIPSLREIWNDTAVFVAPDDTEGIRSAVEHLIHDPDRRWELAARARLRAVNFSVEKMVESYLAAYARLTSPQSAPERSSSALLA